MAAFFGISCSLIAMNEDEIDISSSSSSSRSTSPVPSGLIYRQIDLSAPEYETEGAEEESKNERELNDSQVNQLVKTAGELTLDELPPVTELNFMAKLNKMEQIGRVCNILDRLVIVASFKNKPPLDLDSVLFLRDCHPLGAIFETFGPVKQPYYAIRFNAPEEVESRKVSIDMAVYFLPCQSPPITSYVFVKDLIKIKGSDASWLDDNEPPNDCLEFSDDEEERLFKLKRK